jgi:hypothetical protein
MATKYIKEPEDKKFSGDGVRAMRRHGGTMVMTYGVKMRVLLAAAGIFVPDMTHLKRCGFFGGGDVQARKIAQSKEKRFRISDRRRRKQNKKSQELRQKKGPTMGLKPTWV